MSERIVAGLTGKKKSFSALAGIWDQPPHGYNAQTPQKPARLTIEAGAPHAAAPDPPDRTTGAGLPHRACPAIGALKPSGFWKMPAHPLPVPPIHAISSATGCIPPEAAERAGRIAASRRPRQTSCAGRFQGTLSHARRPALLSLTSSTIAAASICAPMRWWGNLRSGEPSLLASLRLRAAAVLAVATATLGDGPKHRLYPL